MVHKGQYAMKSFKEYLRLNESIVDQYIEVRKQARPGDQLILQHNFDSGTDSSLFSHIGPLEGSVQKTPTETRPARIGNTSSYMGGDAGSYRYPADLLKRMASLGVKGVSEKDSEIFKDTIETHLRRDLSVGNHINSNSHELAHAYQHQAEIRDNLKRVGPMTDSDKKILSLPLESVPRGDLFQHLQQLNLAKQRGERIFGKKSRIPRLNPSFRAKEAIEFIDDRTYRRNNEELLGMIGKSEGRFGAWSTKTRSGKRKNERDQKIIDSGIYGGGSTKAETPFNSQYINSDGEVNSRIIGHAGEHLDFRPNLSNQDITRHMMSVADELQHHPTTKEGVRSAIETVRNQSLDAFKNSEELDRSSKDSLKKSTRQYTRLIQHHESELPSDLHTEEGRSRFIASASPRSKSDLPPTLTPILPILISDLPAPPPPREEIPNWQKIQMANMSKANMRKALSGKLIEK